jgi:hypothetical protein
MGQLVFQANAGGQTALVGPNPSTSISINIPATNGNMVTTGDSGTVTSTMLASSVYTAPGTIGSGTPNSGAFTTLSASSTVSGTGFSDYLASPPAIGGTTRAAGSFTTVTTTNDSSISGLTVGKGGGAVSTNTAFGNGAIASTATGGSNTSVGYQTLAAVTSGDSNSAFGIQALNGNTTGANNTSIGRASLGNNTTGSSNIAVGRDSLLNNTTASNNTAVGYQAGYSQTTGGSSSGFNTFIGRSAGFNTTGPQNQFFGESAGVAVTTGGKNVILGSYSGNQGGLDIRTASNWIVLSDGDGNSNLIIDNSVNAFFGGQIKSSSSNGGGVMLLAPFGAPNGGQVRVNKSDAGTATIFSGGYFGQVGSITMSDSALAFNTTSDYRLKDNITPMVGALDKVKQLNPVTYTWKRDNSTGQGFIAHEIQAIVPDCVVGEKDAISENGEPDYQQVDYSKLVATLTSAIQELNAKVDAQALEIATLKGN